MNKGPTRGTERSYVLSTSTTTPAYISNKFNIETNLASGSFLVTYIGDVANICLWGGGFCSRDMTIMGNHDLLQVTFAICLRPTDEFYTKTISRAFLHVSHALGLAGEVTKTSKHVCRPSRIILDTFWKPFMTVWKVLMDFFDTGWTPVGGPLESYW